MKVVILCGGKGTRLGLETKTIPKPMAKIDNEPIILHIINYYKKFGYNDFILALGYKGALIKKFFEKKINAWHLHKEATLNYACVYGKVKLVLFYERKKSKTFGRYQELFLSLQNYSLITIPPNIWNGFIGLNKEHSIIANCLDLPHNEKEMVRLEIDDERFSYKW